MSGCQRLCNGVSCSHGFFLMSTLSSVFGISTDGRVCVGTGRALMGVSSSGTDFRVRRGVLAALSGVVPARRAPLIEIAEGQRTVPC